MIKGKSQSKTLKFLPCDENSQVYSCQRTNKKSMQVPKKEFQRQLKSFNIKTFR